MLKLKRHGFALALVGLMLSWMFFPPVMMAGFFPETRAYTYANETLLGFCLFLFLGAAWGRRFLGPLFSRQRGIALSIVLLSLAGYGLLLLGFAIGYSLPLALAATFLLSVGYVALMLCWVTLLAQLESRQTMALLFASAIGYAALTLGNFLPLEGRMALCGLSAAASGVCWFATSTPATDSAPPPTYSNDFSALRHAPFALLGLLAVLLIGGRIVTGLYFNLDKDVPFGELFMRCASIACIMAYCLFSARRNASLEQGLRNTWIPAAGLFLLGAMMIIGLTGPATYVGLGITHGAHNCFEFLAYLIIFKFFKNDRVSPIMAMSLGMVVFKVLPIALQRLIFPRIIATLGLTEADVVPAVILMSMVVLVCVLAFANHRLTSAELHALAQGDEADATDRSAPPMAERPTFEGACASLAAEAELSERETEIMALIAHGHSQKHISETLYLALGTVQWYAKAIYRKLGIHSKQELINLVNDRLGSE